MDYCDDLRCFSYQPCPIHGEKEQKTDVYFSQEAPTSRGRIIKLSNFEFLMIHFTGPVLGGETVLFEDKFGPAIRLFEEKKRIANKKH